MIHAILVQIVRVPVVSVYFLIGVTVVAGMSLANALHTDGADSQLD